MKYLLFTLLILSTTVQSKDRSYFMNKYRNSFKYKQAVVYTENKIERAVNAGSTTVRLNYKDVHLCLLMAKKLYKDGFVIVSRECNVSKNSFWDNTSVVKVSIIGNNDTSIEEEF